MNIIIRSYTDADYEQVKALYLDSSLYGGQFDEARDGRDALQKRINADSQSILVTEINGIMVGTISYIEDGRGAILFRFAVQKGSLEPEITKALYDTATIALKAKGHTQVLVYTPAGNEPLLKRYEELGMHQGNDYTCFWTEL